MIIINEKIEFALKQKQREDWDLCSYKDLEKFFEEYPYWAYYEFDHCCRDWQEECWIEMNAKGNWGLSFEEILEDIKNIFCSHEILQAIIDEPQRFRKKILEDGSIELFLTLRDNPNCSNMDLIFFGFKEQEAAEEC